MSDEADRPICEFDPEKLVQRLDTEIEGEPRAVAPVVDRIMKEVATMGCAADHEFEIRLALSEAIANAVRHGCRNDPSKRVRICVECQAERGILIVVEGPGEGFDPSQLPSPIESEQIFRSGGRACSSSTVSWTKCSTKRAAPSLRCERREPARRPGSDRPEFFKAPPRPLF